MGTPFTGKANQSEKVYDVEEIGAAIKEGALINYYQPKVLLLVVP